MLLIRHADIYSPTHIGYKDLLIEKETIIAIEDNLSALIDLPYIETLDVQGRVLVPGYIDLHEHITGGGGEGGPATRVPESNLSTIISSGVTTVVGLLGTDGTSRSLENLIVKTKSYNDLGITCFALNGSYAYPPITITDTIESDLMMISEIVGVKTAMSDHRSSNLNADQLIQLSSAAYRGGMLSGKAGYTTIHMGDGKAGLQSLFETLQKSDVPIQKFLPTHITRNERLLKQGIEFIKQGGTIDVTAGETNDANIQTARKILHISQEAGMNHITISSDAYGSMPKFNENHELIGLTYSTPKSLHELLKILTDTYNIPLEQALLPLTINPARILSLTNRKGQIKTQYDADMIIYDEQMNIDTVIARGQFAYKNKKVLMKGPFDQS